MIRFSCPQCHKSLKAEDEHVGRRVRCPTCNHSFEVSGSPADLVEGQGRAEVREPVMLPDALDFVSYRTSVDDYPPASGKKAPVILALLIPLTLCAIVGLFAVVHSQKQKREKDRFALKKRFVEPPQPDVKPLPDPSATDPKPQPNIPDQPQMPAPWRKSEPPARAESDVPKVEIPEQLPPQAPSRQPINPPGEVNKPPKESDAIGEKLEKAKMAYEESKQKCRQELLDQFQAKEDAVRREGDKKKLDQVKRERELFKTDGTLPTVVPSVRYKGKLSSAAKDLLAAYNEAIKAYIKAHQDDKADEADKEAQLLGQSSASPPAHDKAIEDCNKAIAANPTDASAYYRRGNAYLAKGDADQAVKDFNEAIRLDPSMVDAYDKRELAYKKRLNEKPVPRYKHHTIEGFHVLVSERVLDHERDPAYARKPLDVLKLELATVVQAVGHDRARLLRSILVWVEWYDLNDPDIHRNVMGKYYGVFGNYALFALTQGKHPLKANGVEIINMKALTAVHQPNVPIQQWALLHEFAHAVHFHFPEFGPHNPQIKLAYQQAIDRKLYDNCYARTNEFEYFAELSCAYFNKLHYRPFTRQGLREYDPDGYRIMEATWGKSKEETARKR